MTMVQTTPVWRWETNRIMAVTALALLPALAMAVAERGGAMIGPVALALGVWAVWAGMFARLRGQPLAWDMIVPALVFVLMLPGAVPLWQQGVALSFGLVLGGLIFGARGRGFVNPAVVALAFLLFSFPGATAGQPGLGVALGAGLGGAVLLLLGLISGRVVLGFGLGLAALMALQPAPDWAALTSATLALGLVFLIADPVAAACTNAGRWVYGGLAGALVAVLGAGAAGVGALAPVVFAALLASVFAALIDQMVIAANVRYRKGRQHHG